MFRKTTFISCEKIFSIANSNLFFDMHYLSQYHHLQRWVFANKYFVMPHRSKFLSISSLLGSLYAPSIIILWWDRLSLQQKGRRAWAWRQQEHKDSAVGTSGWYSKHLTGQQMFAAPSHPPLSPFSQWESVFSIEDIKFL